MKYAKYLYLLPLITILSLLGLYPLIYAIYLSTMRYRLLDPLWKVKFIGLSNYIWIFKNDLFYSVSTTTLIFAGTVVAAEFLLGLALAFLTRGLTRGASITRTFLAIPLLISPTIVAIMFNHMYEPYFGIFNYILSIVGLPKQGWLISSSMALPSIIIADIWEWTPFMYLVLFAAIQSVPETLLESSSLDGASSWSQFRYIILPWIKPAALVVVLFRTIDALKEADKIFWMTYGGPGAFETATLHFWVWFHGMLEWQMGEATALSIIYLILINVIVMVIYKSIKKAKVE